MGSAKTPRGNAVNKSSVSPKTVFVIVMSPIEYGRQCHPQTLSINRVETLCARNEAMAALLIGWRQKVRSQSIAASEPVHCESNRAASAKRDTHSQLGFFQFPFLQRQRSRDSFVLH